MPDFNLGFPEIVVLVILAVIMFGPEKLPDLARKAARVVAYVRGIANDARGQLTEQLGPEFSDLRPAALVQNLLGEGNLDDVKAAVADTRQALRQTGGTLREAGETLAEDGRSFAEAGRAATSGGGADTNRTPSTTPASHADDDDQPVDEDGAHLVSGGLSLVGAAASGFRDAAPFDPEAT